MRLGGLMAAAAGAALLAFGGGAYATVYTSDGTLADFASATTNFAVLSDFSAGDVVSPYATTYAGLSAGLRVYDGTFSATDLPSNNYILATFSSAVSKIRVFPNIDHFGSSYDGYQYDIFGSNDLSTWTPLFDSTSVTGGGEPFTLGTFTGTAPTDVNNVLTPGAGPGGTVGYIADFSFGSSYKYYVFGASSVAFASGNTDQELSGIAGIGVPEPATWALMLVGVGMIGAGLRLSRGKSAAVAGLG